VWNDIPTSLTCLTPRERSLRLNSQNNQRLIEVVGDNCGFRSRSEVWVKYRYALLTLFLISLICAGAQAQTTRKLPPPVDDQSHVFARGSEAISSPYVPIDNWIYPALDRLHALGYIDTAYLGLRPWTRLSIAHMLELSADDIDTDTDNYEARELFYAALHEVEPNPDTVSLFIRPKADLESTYTRLQGISGTPLRDSFHLGQTIINDYGRPYAEGFNNYSGFSTRAAAGRISLYFRGEFQHVPSFTGYSQALASYLSDQIDDVPYATNPVQDTIPQGPIASVNTLRIVEANLSYHLLGHEISIGKNDHWLSPDMGASMLWSNNAENIYAFEINRVEPLRIPGLSRLTGKFRYDFFVGSLKGHTYPNDPWVHMEKVSFKPTRNLEFGFDRMTIWGGKGHAPITAGSFLHSFFSFQDVSDSEKYSRNDPGARFGTFDFTYRLPFLRRWVTLYTDSLVHDNMSPISAPLRSGLHPGIYLARFPEMEHLDLRVEGASTDTVSATKETGHFLYWEAIQRQGPTNKGLLVGDWIGRQGKGGQAWLTYHLSPQENVQLIYRNAKASNDFIPGGTTQNDYSIQICKRVKKDIEIRGAIQHETWTAPIYKVGQQNDTTTAVQITWFPPESR
jgi:Capsule assembly protein Wzi